MNDRVDRNETVPVGFLPKGSEREQRMERRALYALFGVLSGFAALVLYFATIRGVL